MTPSDAPAQSQMMRNIALYPWFKFFQNLLFWQAVWFLFFQDKLSASQAILLYMIYDLATTSLEVPSGYLSDRIGRRFTLLLSAFAAVGASLLLLFGATFEAFVLAQVLWGTSAAFASGTDSSILFESLAAVDRADKVEAHELRAWRFTFTGLALSAATGGAMSLVSFELAFAATAVAMVAWAVCALLMTEPPRSAGDTESDVRRILHLKEAFRNPVLIWLFVFSALMYGFSHIPFVFGQPFILEALNTAGWSGEAPLVSGIVSTLMMLLSVAGLLVGAWFEETHWADCHFAFGHGNSGRVGWRSGSHEFGSGDCVLVFSDGAVVNPWPLADCPGATDPERRQPGHIFVDQEPGRPPVICRVALGCFDGDNGYWADVIPGNSDSAWLLLCNWIYCVLRPSDCRAACTDRV